MDTQLIKVQVSIAKPKYSLETRLAVVNHYLAGHDGARRTAERFDGIPWKNDRHFPEFRLTVVLKALSEELTMREAAARFNISNESVVRHWVKVYKDISEEGFMNIKPGRSKDMTKPQKTPPLTDAELEKLSPEELRTDLR